MVYEATAPTCVVDGCNRLSALSAVATGRFWRFRTNYCSDCYQKLVDGADLTLDPSRIVLERISREPEAK